MFTGQHIAVRPIRKRSGNTTWAIYRPHSPNRSALDEFESEVFADRVTELIENRFGGSYASTARREAKRIARLEPQKGGTE